MNNKVIKIANWIIKMRWSGFKKIDKTHFLYFLRKDAFAQFSLVNYL